VNVFRENFNRLIETFSQPERPTATLRVGPMHDTFLAAASVGLSVPDDLSVMMVADPSLLSQASAIRFLAGLEITVYEMPVNDLGRIAAEMLLKKIDNPTVPLPAQALPFKLRQGQTVAPA
jgi:DNA-binding LacI/PurR family transcriptional regulator